MNTLLLGVLLSLPLSATDRTPVPCDSTRGWAILVDGRVKPLDTFARETVIAITGRPGWDGFSPLEILWGFRFEPKAFRARELVRVDSQELKARLGLDPERKRFAFDELMGRIELQRLVGLALEHKGTGPALARVEQDALDTSERLHQLAGLINGDALQIVPVLAADGSWSTPDQLANAAQPARQAIHASWRQLAAAYQAGDAKAFRGAAADLTVSLAALDPARYPTAQAIDRELAYNSLNPFGKAWMLYLAGFLAVALSGFLWRRLLHGLGLLFLGLGAAAHTTGIALRWLIAERAPVSDMYESLVFVGFGVIAIGLLLEAGYRNHWFALASGLMGFLTLMFAERLPLDSGINPLVPVLAHTSWLSIHVMTILLSYSAFALTMALGHVVIGIQLFRPGRTELLRTLSSLLYKTLQVGLLFLVAGILFGAIWANESWGRYWGWDPKETWSLITFFVYLAIVHARFAGWLHPFGLAVSAILGFLSVLMTYYGVNFLLGTGLHSYGFASGGTLWVGLYLLAELLVIAAAAWRYRAALTGGRSVPAAAQGG